MANTEFYRETTDLNQNFKWTTIFNETFKRHTQKQKDNLIVSGCESFMPSEATMLDEWTKPWLYARFGIWGIVFSALMLWMFKHVAASYSVIVLLMVVPAFVTPVTMLLFIYEMNVPRNISLIDLLKWVMFAGLISCSITFVIRDLLGMESDAAAWIGGPIPEEIAKLLMVVAIIYMLDTKYTLNGILIGCAVGVGFAAQESAGYAFNTFLSTYSQSGALDMDAIMDTGVIRGMLAFGGHSCWAALYGGAIAHIKGREKLNIKHFAHPLFWITFLSAIVLHVVWNFDWINKVILKMDNEKSMQTVYNIMYKYYGLYIVLIIVGWAILLKLIRMGLVEIINIGRYAKAGNPSFVQQQPMQNMGMQAQNIGVMQSAAAYQGYNQNAMANQGRVSVTGNSGIFAGQVFYQNQMGQILFGRGPQAMVRFPEGTQGISGNHCEIKYKEGYLVLIDRGSSYGTFFADGTKLQPNVPYPIQQPTVFYLATPDNSFTINI